MEMLKWISDWFSSHCDRDWEHENQIKIETVSNPGWYITIDLRDTPLEDLVLKMDTVNKGADDWYFYNFEDSKFKASGDLNKIHFLLNEFKKIVESQKNMPA